MTGRNRKRLTSAHWGTYELEVKDGRVTALNPFDQDPDPSPIGPGILDVLEGPTRITSPMVRKGWLDHGPGAQTKKRGLDSFVEVSWDEVNRMVAKELNRVRNSFGNQAIYAGSYGWASAGRFHHAQSQLKRFLNCVGGFTSSRNTYSFAAAEVVVPHILGSFRDYLDTATCWDSIASDCELVVAFGGIPLKNGQISQGGTGAHVQQAGFSSAHDAGVTFINISPLRSDMSDHARAEWLPIRPNTDVALMLALAYVLLDESLHDCAFLEHYTVGFEHFAAYLKGDTDGTRKSPEWAADICEVGAETIQALARRMARSKTMISTAWALTRQDHGEQPFWAAIALASMLGQIGLPGTGLTFGYSAMNYLGQKVTQVPFASFPQGTNPVSDFIPVARITDMLENPGGPFDYNGGKFTYPDIKVIWWAGGNPFHHHQDLNRFCRAWQKPQTVIVNEWCWNALAKHADIILPCTTTLERSDIALTSKDPYQVVMDQAIAPIGQARNDHDIFCALARAMDVEDAFTEGRSPEDWQRWIWDRSRQKAAQEAIELPDWESFQNAGWFKVPVSAEPMIMLQEFRKDPEANPLKTPSGKIEIYSNTIANFDYDDCIGHPAWMKPVEWLGNAETDELHLISNQPHNKLHSQLDHGAVSVKDRPNGVEPVTMHPSDAASRGLEDGQRVRIHNSRGACFAELRISTHIRPGVIQLATGAWLNPEGEVCQRGNPNILTRDKGTSRLAQGPIAQSCLVKVAAADII